MKSYKEFIKEITTGDVPVTQQGPYRNSGMLNSFIARRTKMVLAMIMLSTFGQISKTPNYTIANTWKADI